MNRKGFSIVQMLVAVGLMSVIGMIFIDMLSNQNKEVKSIDEKMGLQRLQTQIMNVFSSPTYCGCFINNHTFNYTSRTWNSFPVSIGSSYSAACTAVGGALLTVGVNNGSYSVRPTGMSMQNITETTANSGNFSANLVITVDQSRLVRARKDISVPMYFTVNMTDPVGARRMTSCSSAATSGAPPLDLATLCGQIGGVYSSTSTPPCQPAYQ